LRENVREGAVVQ